MLRKVINHPATWMAAPVLMVGLAWAALKKGMDPIPEAEAERIIAKLNENARKDKAVDWEQWINGNPQPFYPTETYTGYQFDGITQTGNDLLIWGVARYSEKIYADLTGFINKEAWQTTKIKKQIHRSTFVSYQVKITDQQFMDFARSGAVDNLTSFSKLRFESYENNASRYFGVEGELKAFTETLADSIQVTSDVRVLELIKDTLESSRKYYTNLRLTLSSYGWSLYNLNRNDSYANMGRSRMLYSQIIGSAISFFSDVQVEGSEFNVPGLSEERLSWTKGSADLVRIEDTMLNPRKKKNGVPGQLDLLLPPSYLDGFTTREKALVAPMMATQGQTLSYRILFSRSTATRRETATAAAWAKLFEQAQGRLPDNLEELKSFGYEPVAPVTDEQLRRQGYTISWEGRDETAGLPYEGMELQRWTLNGDDMRGLLEVPGLATLTTLTREMDGSELVWHLQIEPKAQYVQDIKDAVSLVQMLWLRRLQEDPRFAVESVQVIDMATSQPVTISDEMLRPHVQNLVRKNNEPPAADLPPLPIVQLDLKLRTPSEVRRIAVDDLNSKMDFELNSAARRYLLNGDAEQFVFPSRR